MRRRRRVGERHGKPGRASGQTGSAITFGLRRKRRPAGAFGGHGATCSQQMIRRSNRARSAPSGALRCTCGRGVGTGVVVEEPKELGPPQLDSVRSVPIGARTNGTGNRVSVKRCQRVRGRETGVESERGIARHAARRDGRCEQVETKANARPSTSGGPVHSSCPGRCAGESPQRRPGRFRFPIHHPHPIPKSGRNRSDPDRFLPDFGGGTGVSGLERGQRRAAARRFTRARSSRTRFAPGPGKNATSSAPASTSASA